ncbi:hypothetical protein RFH07_15815 [Acinetobacter seifertii]|uniref:hypothetical protein n=1 Tax=Acinetobacter seifertii TaxID=1530123 RepID=UPI00280CC443|nr:hypothetical protein [Acinetobacter seifertii]MDQ9038050.1 hypothetical protein [Acinetobacter seifertii]
MGFLFENKRQVWLLVILIILIWLVFPFLFKAFMSWMSWIGADLKTFADYGPVGDIYGSLNTLFTSATLIIVMYSAYLQREANKDARESMDKQLKQARSATAKQLLQARRALKLQLEQANDSTKKQIDLAQATHEAQMLESKYAVFTSMFNVLLSQRKTILDSIYTGKEEFKPKVIFVALCSRFETLIEDEWKVLNHNDPIIEEKILDEFLRCMNYENIDESFSFNELTSYFYILVPLLTLIKNSNLKDEDKAIFYMVLSHSMTHDEQMTLLWFAIFSEDIKVALKNTRLIDTLLAPELMDFMMINYDKSYFSHPDVLEYWNSYENQTPA